MNRGIYAAASGMIVSQQMMDTIANNLANASSNGFKRDSLSFDEAVLRELLVNKKSIGTLGAGPAVRSSVTIFEQGNMMSTGNPLDVAILGKHGMFGVQVGNAIRYTRDGSFGVNENGILVTKQGYPVLDVNQRPIQVPKGKVAIADDGNLQVDDQNIAQIGLFDVARTDPTDGGFAKIGSNLYVSLRQATALGNPGQSNRLKQGTLESSNVDAVDSMVQMIGLSRAFEMAQRSIQSQDELSQRLIQSLSDR